MLSKTWILAALAAIACAPKVTEPEPAPVDVRAQPPAPLDRPEFTLPPVQTATLSNGIEVKLVENHELPLVSVRAVFSVGRYADPEGRAGIARATLDMMNEGAGDYDVLGLSAALKALATDLGTSASWDTASVSLGALSRNLEPSLDLWADVLLRPTFPESEWERLQKQYLQDLASQRSDPDQIARRAYRRMLYGDRYVGDHDSEDSYSAMTVDEMRGWYARYLTPENAMILVGGDTTLEQVVPLLEARLSGWPTSDARAVPPADYTQQPEETTIYLIDKPGAAQSVLRGGRFVSGRSDEGWSDLELGNAAWGGMFTARLNMNLREDKGYTYGASSFFWHNYGPSMWAFSTSVRTDATVDSLKEVFAELEAVAGDRPLTADEIAYMQSSMVNGYPARFEGDGYLLDRQAEIWLYGLPEDWIESFSARVEAVTVERAQEAFVDAVASQPLKILVVGDLSVIREGIESLGYPTILLDEDGDPI